MPIDLDHPVRYRAAPGKGRDGEARSAYLIDAAARIREIYSLAFSAAHQAWIDIESLLRER